MSDAGRVILIVLGVVLLVAAVLPLLMLGMMSAMMGGMMGGGMMGGPWPMVVFTLVALVAGVALLVIGLRRPGASTGS